MLVSVSLTKITNYGQNQCWTKLWVILLTERTCVYWSNNFIYTHSFCTPFLSYKNYLFGLRVSVITIGKEDKYKWKGNKNPLSFVVMKLRHHCSTVLK